MVHQPGGGCDSWGDGMSKFKGIPGMNPFEVLSTRTASELMRAHVESVSELPARRHAVWPYVAVIALCVGVWIGTAI